jgi:hypothetical protein
LGTWACSAHDEACCAHCHVPPRQFLNAAFPAQPFCLSVRHISNGFRCTR